MEIKKPTLVVDKAKTLSNIKRMNNKVKASGNVRFRPHFKTHQSAETGQWFRDLGVTAIAVSSVDMAAYFARHGWRDITIAILANQHEIPDMLELIKQYNLRLSLLADSMATVALLEEHFYNQQLNEKIDMWIKVDTGYHRTGIDCNDKTGILAVAKAIQTTSSLRFQGLLTHAGHSYHPPGTSETNGEVRKRGALKAVYNDAITKLNDARDYLRTKGFPEVEISFGDTPTCSVVESFEGVDEVRCGNFVYYDLMQRSLGVCREEDISVAVACPVLGCYPERSEIVIYGGAVHLSKESIKDKSGNTIYGLVALPNQDFTHWSSAAKNTYVSEISQEHGVIKAADEFIHHVKPGDILMILPVHSCLTVNLMR